MKKISVVLCCFTAAFIMFSSNALPVFAAAENNSVRESPELGSRVAEILLFIGLFTAAFVLSGVVTYKRIMKKNRSKSDKEKKKS